MGMGILSSPRIRVWVEFYTHRLYGYGYGITLSYPYPTHCHPQTRGVYNSPSIDVCRVHFILVAECSLTECISSLLGIHRVCCVCSGLSSAFRQYSAYIFVCRVRGPHFDTRQKLDMSATTHFPVVQGETMCYRKTSSHQSYGECSTSSCDEIFVWGGVIRVHPNLKIYII